MNGPARAVDTRQAQDGPDLLLWDAARLPRARPHHFDPDWWSQSGELSAVAAGRGAAWFVRAEGEEWVLRHYRRGGAVARWVEDQYLWTGAERARAFAEWRLLARLTALGLPVPQPVAARVRRHGWLYRADLLTVRVAEAESLAEHIRRKPLASAQWQALGQLLGRFHAAGVYHHDLNAHNILLDRQGRFILIDFDRSRIRRPGRWRRRNLARLRRSLDKLGGERPGFRFGESDWTALRGGYASGY